MESVPSLEACRVCANFYVTSGEVDLLNLFDANPSLQKELVFIASELKAWQLNISCNDGLPQRICGNCFTKFCGIYSFRAECLEAQEKLLQAFVEGDCAEEIVTAQETILNELLPMDLPVGSEEIVGLDSMLGVHTDNIMQYTAKPEEMKNELNAEASDCNGLLPVSPIPNAKDQAMSENFFQNISENMKVETTTQDLQYGFPEDFEEILQGNYIPKQIKTADENADFNNDGLSYNSDVSSVFEEENSSLQAGSALNPLACQYCYAKKDQLKTFSSAEALSQHFFDAHDPTFPYTCPECPLKFVNEKLRLLHVKQKHQTKYQQIQQKERLCQYCGKPLRDTTREEHMEHCRYLGDWECDDCGLKFTQVTHYTFKAHVQREHSAVKKQLKCKECGRVFSQRTLWENHLQLHAKNTVLWCNECKEAFADAYELKKHKYKMHNGELPVNCDYCKKGFVTYAFLHRHIQHFHPEKLNDGNHIDMTCRNCGTEFNSLIKLRNHQQKPLDENGRCTAIPQVQRKVARVGIFPCEICSRRFHVKAYLDKHMRSHEIAKQTYQCKVCQVMFRSPSELKLHHEIAHLHIKHFVCDHCGKKFAYKKDLRDHMIYHEVNKIRCPEPKCGQICKNEKLLNDHIRQNHRLFPCKYCNETFTQYRLIQHMQNNHKIEIDADDSSQSYSDVSEAFGNVMGNGIDAVGGDVPMVAGVTGDADVAVNAENVRSAQEKVVVEFVGNLPSNDINLQDQLGHQYPITDGSIYNPFEDYAAELIVEQENDIDVT